MELKINASEFKAFGKKYTVFAVLNDDVLSLFNLDLRRDGVPYERLTVATDGETNHAYAAIQSETISGAAEYVKVSNWKFEDSESNPLELGKMCVEVKTENMKESLTWLVEASSRDAGRPNLNGVFVATNDGMVDLVSTDGHRLGWDNAVNEIDGQPDSRNIVSRVCIEKALKLAGKKGDLGVMKIYRKCVQFTGLPGYTFLFAIIELEYPEFRRVIPSGFNWNFRVDFAAVKAFVARGVKIKKVARDKYSMMYFDVTNDSVTVSVKDGNNETISEVLAGGFTEPRPVIDGCGGERFKIAFNVNYMQDALDGMTGEPDNTVILRCKGEASACLIQDGNRKCVLMPVRM
jgi:DNA polymerase III subunit beta